MSKTFWLPQCQTQGLARLTSGYSIFSFIECYQNVGHQMLQTGLSHQEIFNTNKQQCSHPNTPAVYIVLKPGSAKDLCTSNNSANVAAKSLFSKLFWINSERLPRGDIHHWEFRYLVFTQLHKLQITQLVKHCIGSVNAKHLDKTGRNM